MRLGRLGLGPNTLEIRDIHTMPSRFDNHRLQNALFLAASASLRHAPSRTYCDRKRAQGKRHNQAVLCLARRRVHVLHAMLTQGVPYRAPAPLAAAA